MSFGVPSRMHVWNKTPHIVCIGGGTGLHAELSGLKDGIPEARLSAVVTMMDSGSNSGKLRDEFGYLPPGDVRQCLVALSDAPNELRALMQHRFLPSDANGTQSSLHGHVVGNILLTAFKDITGDEYAAIEAMERTLRIKGKVYPVTLTNSNIVVRLADGKEVRGEGNLYGEHRDLSLPIAAIALDPPAQLFEKTREVLESADYILIGPGGLHHSILPNLIVDGMQDALRLAKENGAKIILVTNTMTKHGDTTGFAASDILRRVQEALGDVAIDAVIANTGAFSRDRLAAYALEQATPVAMDLEDGHDLLVIGDDLVSDESFLKHGKPCFARHDPVKLSRAVRRAIDRLSLRSVLSGNDTASRP